MGYGDYGAEGRRVADAQGYTYGPADVNRGAYGAPYPPGVYKPRPVDEDAWFGRDTRADYYDEENRGFWERASDEVASWFGDDDAERRRALDRERGGKSGRGPRGYTRSDDRIREDVNDRLTDDDYLDASEIDVTVEAGVVTLSGTVEDRWAKRRAEEVAERVSGVADVLNRIRVDRAAQTAPGAVESAGTAGIGGSVLGTSGVAGTSGTPTTATDATVSPTNASGATADTTGAADAKPRGRSTT